MTTKSLPLCLRLRKRPTKWLAELPPGNYTVSELEEKTGKVASTIKQRLNLLGIPRSYSVTTGYPHVVYSWVGIEEYEKQQNALKPRKMSDYYYD